MQAVFKQGGRGFDFSIHIIFYLINVEIFLNLTCFLSTLSGLEVFAALLLSEFPSSGLENVRLSLENIPSILVLLGGGDRLSSSLLG